MEKFIEHITEKLYRIKRKKEKGNATFPGFPVGQ